MHAIFVHEDTSFCFLKSSNKEEKMSYDCIGTKCRNSNLYVKCIRFFSTRVGNILVSTIQCFLIRHCSPVYRLKQYSYT